MTRSKRLAATLAGLAAGLTVAALFHPSARAGSAPVVPTPTPFTRVVLHLSGTASVTTPTVVTDPAWSLGYTFNCPAAASGFRVLEWGPGENGVPLVDRVGSEGVGATYSFAAPGAHRLQVVTACSWTLKVTDGDSMPLAGSVTPTAWGIA